MKKLFALILCLAGTLALKANVPDSVYLFSYANADGSGGLKLAWSADARSWNSLNSGNSFVNSDFGPWGRMKKMFAPKLVRLGRDGEWQCTWNLSKDGDGMATVTSPDLIKWNPQKYFNRSKAAAFAPKGALPVKAVKAIVGGKEYDGYCQKVAYSTVLPLIRFSEQQAYRRQLNNARITDVKDYKPFSAKLTIYPDSTKAISDKLIGIFFEDINYGADGGLYAELVQNRDFEYAPGDNHHARWSPATAWTALQGADTVALDIATASPVHPNNPHYAVVKPGQSIENGGYDGIAVRKGEKYRISFFARGKGRVDVSLRGANDSEISAKSFKINSQNWKKYTAEVAASASTDNGRIRVAVNGDNSIDLDLISLFPKNTFKGHENGLRPDLAQALADLHPRFVRFPGGCVAHGDGIDNIYDWKGSIGPLESRKPLRNLWNYHQTRGLGYHEYFQFCEDIGAAPLPVLAAGVPCQNSGTCGHHSHDEVSSYGQQGGIPMDEMPAYIQDILDLVEYADGDARTTKWGALRAKNGHPAPFNLKYLGIGNEDMITEPFETRFAMIADAVKAKYPDIQIVGTVGPFYEGTDYDRGWEFATGQNIPLVDEHYYVSPGWMIANNDYYDAYDRTKPHVYLGEYAAHIPGRLSNIETSLAEAAYLTGVERNGDVVEMTSYAPLLAKEGHTQWRPDLIYFTNTEVRPTVDYYVQQLFGQNSGNRYVNAALELSDESQYATTHLRSSVVFDEATGDYIVKLVNLTPAEVSVEVDLGGIPAKSGVRTILSGAPDDSTAKPVSSEFTVTSPTLTEALPAHSLTVLRIK